MNWNYIFVNVDFTLLKLLGVVTSDGKKFLTLNFVVPELLPIF